MVADLDGQLAAWLEHPVTRRMLAVPERIREVERFERVHLGGVPIFLALDVLMEDGDGGFVVVDWKTGRNHGSEVDGQLRLYGWHVRQRFRHARRVLAMEATTRDGGHRTLELTPHDTHEAREHLHESVELMKSWLLDPSKDQAIVDTFPRLDDGAEACTWCRWRRPCGREDEPRAQA